MHTGLIMALGLLSTGACAQDDPFGRMPKWTVEQLHEDFDALVRALKDHHPALYRYCTPQALDRTVDSLRTSLDRPATEFELLGRITALYPLLGDGHTIFLPTEEWAGTAPARYFPLPVVWSDTALYIGCGGARTDHPHCGARIQAINGVPASAIMGTLLTRQIRDGVHTSYANWILNRWFRSYYRFSFGEPERFHVLLDQNGERVQVMLEALVAAELPIQPSPEPERALELSFPDDSIALLRIGSFQRDRLKPREVDAAFVTIREHGIRRLVLDLRGNQGGEPRNAKRLLAHLLNRRFNLVVKGPSAGITRPVRNPFSGSLCTLMDGGSFSATAMVLAQLEASALGPLIGEESGGNRTVISGSARTYHLPNTRIACTISRKDWWLQEGEADGRGVMPTYAIANDDEDDTTLLEAIRIIRLPSRP
ncbi:MAG: S41 family peptidase [Flavobacteriales bacterium]